MDRKSIEEALQEAVQAISIGGVAQFEAFCKALDDNLIFFCDNFPEEIFQMILSLLKRREILELEESRCLFVQVLMYNWEFLSEEQKERLLPALKDSYEKFEDWMSWFVIYEIIGEYYQDRRAFETLCSMKTLEKEGPRAFVSHGLEHIVQNESDEELSQEALAELLQMKNDPSEQVRYEVSISLQRLSNLGIDITDRARTLGRWALGQRGEAGVSAGVPEGDRGRGDRGKGRSSARWGGAIGLHGRHPIG